MRHETVAIALLRPHEHNYRRHSELQLRNLRASLERFGQVRSIIAQKKAGTYVIVAGHGVVEAAKSLRWTEMQVEVLPEAFSESEVAAYLVADNQLRKHAYADEEQLALLLSEQRSLGYDLATIGSSEQELEALLQSLETDREIDWFADDAPLSLPSGVLRATSVTPETQALFPVRGATLVPELHPPITSAVLPEEKAEVYYNGSIRQVVLLFNPEAHREFLRKLSLIRAHRAGLETNTDAIEVAVQSYLETHQLAASVEV